MACNVLTFGVVPSDTAILAAFDRECPEGYSVALGRGDSATLARAGSEAPSHGDWTGPELVDVIGVLSAAWRDEGDEDAGLLASSILSTLGFEWI